ncbi:hypothetical protein [Acidicapsa acidisoli]|uniref:hypothetical protein n=1 Tax=Acidicapsa acidisoli TaxID=1615681 RepID=UPI0021DF62E2|nr:hypothetical protein [Acidicapsa acidisoli]
MLRRFKTPVQRTISFQLAMAATLLLCAHTGGASPEAGQMMKPSSLVETGYLSIAGREVPYRIRNLPVSSFPELPSDVADALTTRGCLIPQTYEAKHPENVIHASLEGPGSNDWAVLCSTQGRVSLLVFFANASPANPSILSAAAETDRLQAHDASGELGFNWGIDPASPSRIHDAQAGMAHRPPAPDHDCLADTTVDHKTVYHLYRNGAWEKLDLE